MNPCIVDVEFQSNISFKIWSVVLYNFYTGHSNNADEEANCTQYAYSALTNLYKDVIPVRTEDNPESTSFKCKFIWHNKRSYNIGSVSKDIHILARHKFSFPSV